MAAATSTAQIGSAFHNNLVRHPVEFAQAALTAQRISGGRFEAGLGAGWQAAELAATGRSYPRPSERAARLIEAVQVVRQLFDTGRCDFEGTHYRVHVSQIDRPDVGPPPLVVAAGGRYVIKSVAPYVDRLELKLAAAATRGGQLDLAALGSITLDGLRSDLEFTRSVRPDVPLAVHVLCRAGEDAATARIASHFPPGSVVGRFFGPPVEVAEAIWALAELGVDRIHLTPGDQRTYSNLASLLLPSVAADPARPSI
jgi:alkanesulfonate monooxygenase SsuD/methylene tetrahydromethanopterin reductase-like flavin-dependent oxidoreductase (luciferase family)